MFIDHEIYADPNPAVHAIVHQETGAMLRDHLVEYRNPNTRFAVTTWRGECTLPPLALAVEVPGYRFQNVLEVLVENAGLDPSAPYEIEDHALGARIRTNPLTHMLARWERYKSDSCRDGVLSALLYRGADATAPALYEVTPLTSGSGAAAQSRPSQHDRDWARERALDTKARPGLSLMAFQMVQRMPVKTPFYFILDLVQNGHARFLPEDPAGLLATAVRTRDPDSRLHWLDCIMDQFCPTVEEQAFREIAMGWLSQGEVATGELRRIVGGKDPQSGMNLLHMYVAWGGEYDRTRIAERIRMLRDVYGLSLMTTTDDGRGLKALAAGSTATWGRRMRDAVEIVLEEELGPRHLALAIVQGLRSQSQLALREIGRRTGLPTLGARELDDRLRLSRSTISHP
jgi:hypothetical protein